MWPSFLSWESSLTRVSPHAGLQCRLCSAGLNCSSSTFTWLAWNTELLLLQWFSNSKKHLQLLFTTSFSETLLSLGLLHSNFLIFLLQTRPGLSFLTGCCCKLFLLKSNTRVEKCTKPKCAPYLNSVHFEWSHLGDQLGGQASCPGRSWCARLMLPNLKGGTYFDGFKGQLLTRSKPTPWQLSSWWTEPQVHLPPFSRPQQIPIHILKKEQNHHI